jgi:hypothetical protein
MWQWWLFAEAGTTPLLSRLDCGSHTEWGSQLVVSHLSSLSHTVAIEAQWEDVVMVISALSCEEIMLPAL